MSEEVLLTKEIKNMVGQQLGQTLVRQVQQDDIRKFIDATGDANPLWQDEKSAEKGPYGRIVAPPTFVFTFRPPGAQDAINRIGEPHFKTGILLGNSHEYIGPISPGDTITAECRLADAREQETKRGKVLALVNEKTYTNQRGEVIARERTTVRRY